MSLNVLSMRKGVVIAPSLILSVTSPDVPEILLAGRHELKKGTTNHLETKLVDDEGTTAAKESLDTCLKALRGARWTPHDRKVVTTM